MTLIKPSEVLRIIEQAVKIKLWVMIWAKGISKMKWIYTFLIYPILFAGFCVTSLFSQKIKLGLNFEKEKPGSDP